MYESAKVIGAGAATNTTAGYGGNPPLFWAYFSGLFEADGFVSKNKSKWALVISGEYTQLNHFLYLGFRVGQPFSLTRGPGKRLVITWTRQSAIDFISRRIKQTLGDQVVSPKIQDLYSLTKVDPHLATKKPGSVFRVKQRSNDIAIVQKVVLHRLVGFIDGDGGFDIEITEKRIDVRIKITQKFPQIFDFFKAELIGVDSAFDNLVIKKQLFLDKRDGKFYEASRLVFGPSSMNAFTKIVDSSFFEYKSREFSFKLSKIILGFKHLYQLARIAGQSQVASKKIELKAWNDKRFKLVAFIDLLLLLKYRPDSETIPRLLKLAVRYSPLSSLPTLASKPAAPSHDSEKAISVTELLSLLKQYPLFFLAEILKPAQSICFISLKDTLSRLKKEPQSYLKMYGPEKRRTLLNNLLEPIFVTNTVSNVLCSGVKSPFYLDVNIYNTELAVLKSQAVSLIAELSDTHDLLAQSDLFFGTYATGSKTLNFYPRRLMMFSSKKKSIALARLAQYSTNKHWLTTKNQS